MHISTHVTHKIFTIPLTSKSTVRKPNNIYAHNMFKFCSYLGKSWYQSIYNVHGYHITKNRTISAISEIDFSLIHFYVIIENFVNFKKLHLISQNMSSNEND